MSGTTPEGRQGGRLTLQALFLEDAARILTASAWKLVSVDMVRDDIKDGPPTNADGTIELINYAALSLVEHDIAGLPTVVNQEATDDAWPTCPASDLFNLQRQTQRSDGSRAFWL